MQQHLSPRLLLLCSAVLLTGCGRDASGAAEDANVPAGGAITLWTDSTELFMEHPALIVGAPDKFAIHLTDLTDFAPLRSGRIVLRFVPQGGGEPLEVVQEEPVRPGIYGPAPAFTRPGVYDLTITVESPQATDVIEVSGLPVYATAGDAPREVEGPDAGIPFLKEQQWKTPAFATAFALVGQASESFEVTGQLVPAAGRMARISAPVAGVVEARGLEGTPAPGQRVTKGQVLAILTPALGEGGSPYAAARAELRVAEDEQARAERLYAAEAIPERRLHEANIRLRAAQEALGGFGGAEALRTDGRIAIRSPLSGVVASRTLAPGSRVDAGAGLFTVIDPSMLWLEASVPAAEASRMTTRSTATFRVPGSDSVFLAQTLVAIGGVIDSLSRTVVAIYEVANVAETLKAGMNALVYVGTGRQLGGVVIPASAVLDEDGRPIVYVQAEGERFEKRWVELAGMNGVQAVVRSGVAAGDRVVTGAAYQVRLASLSTSVPEHGHEH
jgi:cobalt-zinc-cadmium efflux system membrane fusion protein